MFKIFNRFRKTTIRDNRISKYLLYAIGEIVLVVIGILIALQINNWNKATQERRQELQVLSDLEHEFNINRSKLDWVMEYKQSSLVNTRKLLKMMQRAHMPFNEIKPAISNTLGVWTFNPSSGTINTLISTGKVDLIQHEKLKYALAQWQDIVLDYQEEESAHLQWFRHIMEPYLTNHLPKKYKGDGGEEFLFHSDAEVEELYLTAFKDIEFQNLYLSNERHLNRAVNEVEPVTTSLDAIMKMIDEQLNELQK